MSQHECSVRVAHYAYCHECEWQYVSLTDNPTDAEQEAHMHEALSTS